jgi:putative intracellular protease/amidase
MIMNTVYVLMLDGYADWEPAPALAELRRPFGFSVRAVGLTWDIVVSMGGLKIVPDLALAEFEPELANMLILPGGDSWMSGEVPEVSRTVRAMIAASRPVAAICAATLALAHAGLLDDRLHTSNGGDFIGRYAPLYRGQEHYRPSQSVSDKSVITANGLAPFAFAAEIFRALCPNRGKDIVTYEKLYSRGLLD